MVDCEKETRIYNTQQANKDLRIQAPGRKQQPKSARVGHAPSPGTLKAKDDLHERRSVPFEAGETSCGPHAHEPEELNRQRVQDTPNKDELHSLVECPS
jgi:hypothetical protein